MRAIHPAASCLAVLLLATPVLAQTPLANLPRPDVSEDAKPSDLLRAAQRAIAAGRTAEGQEALEMAQTRMLDRSVPLFKTNDPSADPTVKQITQARQALDAGDRSGCLDLIQAAIASATAQGS